MDYKVVIAGILGIGPALVLLFHAMRKYDVPFVDEPLFDSGRLFMLFAVGMIFGGIATLLTFGIVPPGAEFSVLLGLLLAIALFEELFKFIVLNMKRFQLKYETTFYGLSLGLGISAVSMLMTSYPLLPLEFNSAQKYVSVALLATYSVGVCTLHASTGSYIGYGSATGYVWNYFFQAMIARVGYAIMIVPFILGTPVLNAIGIAAASIFSVLLYVHIYYHILPETLPDKERKRKRRTIRRMKISSKD